MLKTITETLGKTCVIGLSYFNAQSTLIKQTMLGGTVIKADKETGITVKLAQHASSDTQPSPESAAHFIIPAELCCWFIAPKGNYHTGDANITITNPDYLVTWDIVQNQKDKADKEQQWWHWHPRTTTPKVNNK